MSRKNPELTRMIGVGRTLVPGRSWVDITKTQLKGEELQHLKSLVLQAGYTLVILDEALEPDGCLLRIEEAHSHL